MRKSKLMKGLMWLIGIIVVIAIAVKMSPKFASMMEPILSKMPWNKKSTTPTV
jgi:hypothetical protein